MSESIATPIYLVGDVHGHLKKLLVLLQRAQLIDSQQRWSGGRARLWFLGDFVDRGPQGIAVVEFVMRLQQEAAAVGGRVEALLGNHELLLLAAYRFGRRSTGLGSNFLTRWRRNGGQRADLAALRQHHLDWLQQLPAMALVADHLLIHADAPLYLRCGRTLEEVNASFSHLLRHSDALVWEETLEDFGARGLFANPFVGTEMAQRFLRTFGGRYLVHGHTPISFLTGQAAGRILDPWIYAGGLCINIDGGLHLGGAGLVYQLRSARHSPAADSHDEPVPGQPALRAAAS
ncbi:metallophosphoesterase [Thermogemmatispora tikiterensis]|uniref:Calcineurin-like phosphoesterase domain-containing protein n=1 Tax=Thermogemmatispora tikiterensis TaxID=1825093 RepID=A0A328VPI8_9CHLR|nr:metallophosphoesterase [Thermogemmatispora tikiterensis]RAQ96105.1 hypothetical protein A4R35_11220 [Thermogemmatispora tikiterensis]